MSCKIEGCQSKGWLLSKGGQRTFPKGYCARHYARLNRYGNPNIQRRASPNNRTKHPHYTRYMSMVGRCTRPSTTNYVRYGGRGITVCKEWLDQTTGFNSYCEYIDSLPNARDKGYTVDRINNDGNYQAGNLRWAPYTIQTSNRGRPRNNTSGYTGVNWDTKKELWSAKIRYEKVLISLGYYTDKKDAILVRKAAEVVVERISNRGSKLPKSLI